MAVFFALLFTTLMTLPIRHLLAVSYRDIRNDLLNNCSHVHEYLYAPTCPFGNYYDVGGNESNCNSLEIALNMEFQRFFYIDDTNENFAVSAQLTARWWVECVDFDIGNRDMSLRIEESQFWTPSMVHLNAIEDISMSDKYSRFFAMKRTTDKPHQIQFFWQKIGVFNSQCSLFFHMFPFDEQECTIQILIKETIPVGRIVVTKSSRSRDIDAFDGPISIDIMSESTTWELIGYSFEDGFQQIYQSNRSMGLFSLRFKRKPEFFIFNFILPCFILISLSLTAFAIKIQNTERLALVVTLLLALAVTHTEVSQHTPPVPQRNLLSNYADLAILHCWFAMTYFAVVNFIYKNNNWMKKNHKYIEMVAFVWFCLEILVINLYLIFTSTVQFS